MVIISILTKQATIQDQRWKSDDPRVTKMLNDEMELQDGFATPSDPNPDLTAARHMVKVFGAKILVAVPPDIPDEDDDGQLVIF